MISIIAYINLHRRQNCVQTDKRRGEKRREEKRRVETYRRQSPDFVVVAPELREVQECAESRGLHTANNATRHQRCGQSTSKRTHGYSTL